MNRAEQTEFDFDRGDQLWMIDRVPIASGDVQDGSATVRVSGRYALSVLRAIDAHARTSGQSWAAAETIAKEIKGSSRHVRRAIRLLHKHEIIIAEWKDGKPTRSRINWGELSLLTRPTKRGQSDTKRGQSDTKRGQYVLRSVRSVAKKRTSPPTPSSEAVSLRDESRCEAHASTRLRDRGDWQSVGERLRRARVSCWRVLLDEIRSQIDEAHASAILDHYESHPGAWGPVALVQRFRAAHADTPATELWWTPTSDWRRAERIRSETRATAADQTFSPPDWVVMATNARRLREAGLGHCVTDEESEAREKFEKRERVGCVK